MNPDFEDFLRVLIAAEARFLVVGAHALAVIQLGLPPRRIDLLTGLTGLTFDQAWADRVLHELGSMEIPFISRAALVTNKRQTGRLKDLADLEALGEKP